MPDSIRISTAKVFLFLSAPILAGCSLNPCGDGQYLHPKYGCKSDPTGLLYIFAAVMIAGVIGVIWNNLKK
ncbi:hypothetical protein [Roseovarius tibetensis]|uniref:hypothetical protein n=1 Tax=Roseovarius tibetensis TaxID=2685897 RepID=UPI003D7F667D